MSGGKASGLRTSAKLLRLAALALIGLALLLGLLAYIKTHRGYHVVAVLLWAGLFLLVYKMRV